MLPLAIALGILSYLALRFIHPLAETVEPGFSNFAKNSQPVFVGIMLFLQFNKVSPHDITFRKWHLWLLLFQTALFFAFAILAILIPEGVLKILVESAMLCFVCPTAAAAGVITDKLGGSLCDTVSYVVMINILAALMIPLVIPMVHPMEDVSFIRCFLAICGNVFPMLVLPLLLAWLVRYTMKRLQRRLIRYTHWAFNIWGISLTLSIYLATRALLTSGISVWVAALICLVSLLCCLIQFAAGRAAGKRSGASNSRNAVKRRRTSITAGQALGQKNSGFLIWLGYSYMTPVTSVAGGLYSIWQNLVNSQELYEQRHHPGKIS